ncbi:hypothetical protein H5392_11040 [Tessaracoccus sp. MC1865]|uniref:hypothetical protein n=1 Tax=unclassified Tessaracoccus TaxID=2635419 RepID=UPI00160186DB|nr:MULTISPECIES: hypothetical protein [unclassified Tessaracoccus]MBB1484391.1 hypothetical protein [Tessaracoccus sp. MC1865]MBB1509257.1 hypothetical protein [Tessaracoccus sp. MC1756]QTO38501.1 hypothetical protein J7D54_05270 [Tessaracoccus sp. MC1865]
MPTAPRRRWEPEVGFLIQRADNVTFTRRGQRDGGAQHHVVQPAGTAAKTYYYRVLAFTNTIQSPWSNTATVVVP